MQLTATVASSIATPAPAEAPAPADPGTAYVDARFREASGSLRAGATAVTDALEGLAKIKLSWVRSPYKAFDQTVDLISAGIAGAIEGANAAGRQQTAISARVDGNLPADRTGAWDATNRTRKSATDAAIHQSEILRIRTQLALDYIALDAPRHEFRSLVEQTRDQFSTALTAIAGNLRLGADEIDSRLA